MDQRTVSSVDRRPAGGRRPGRRIRSTNPARLDDVVAEVALGDAAQLVAAARAARDAQQAWADVPAPVRGRVIAHIGRLVEANKEALARAGHPRDRQAVAEALGEVQEIIDTCDFFLGEGRRLYGQTVPSEMPRQAAVHVPRAGRRRRRSITAGNFPVAVPSWYLVPALLCGNAVVWKPAEYAAAVARRVPRALRRGGGLPARRPQHGATPTARRRSTASRRRWTPGWSTRSASPARQRGRRADRRARRPAPADAVPRARRQEPAGRHAGRRPRPRRRGRAVLRASAPPGSAARRSAR